MPCASKSSETYASELPKAKDKDKAYAGKFASSGERN